MSLPGRLTTSEITSIFAEEITAQGGRVTDTFDDGARVFLRAVLPAEQEVKAGDRLQGGVALRATDDDVWVHPYVFRQICSNGAIIARATQTLHIEQSDFSAAFGEEELAGAIRDAVRDCCAPDAFDTTAGAMRSLVHSPIDIAVTIASMFSRLPEASRAEVLDAVFRNLRSGEDRSRFALMNAVTAVARDTRDPDARWNLEEIGGAIPFEANETLARPRHAVLTA
jgi:hypothetical protein